MINHYLTDDISILKVTGQPSAFLVINDPVFTYSREPFVAIEVAGVVFNPSANPGDMVQIVPFNGLGYTVNGKVYYTRQTFKFGSSGWTVL